MRLHPAPPGYVSRSYLPDLANKIIHEIPDENHRGEFSAMYKGGENGLPGRVNWESSCVPIRGGRDLIQSHTRLFSFEAPFVFRVQEDPLCPTDISPKSATLVWFEVLF
jgi:hypothetical protein